MTAQTDRPYVDLGKHVADKTILDRDDRFVGKVDDVVLELGANAADGSQTPPEVVAIVTGPLALARNLPWPLPALARAIYRALGVASPRPVEIPWHRVAAIDVVLHVDERRRELGATVLADAVERTIVGKLPGAGVRP